MATHQEIYKLVLWATPLQLMLLMI